MPKFKDKSLNEFAASLIESSVMKDGGTPEMLDFINDFQELAEDWMAAIQQSRKSTIFVRKEQSELAKQSADLAETLFMAQRDIEISIKHTNMLH